MSSLTGNPVKDTETFRRYSFYPSVGGCAEGTIKRIEAYRQTVGENRMKRSNEVAIHPCRRHFRQLVYTPDSVRLSQPFWKAMPDNRQVYQI